MISLTWVDWVAGYKFGDRTCCRSNICNTDEFTQVQVFYFYRYHRNINRLRQYSTRSRSSTNAHYCIRAFENKIVCNRGCPQSLATFKPRSYISYPALGSPFFEFYRSSVGRTIASFSKNGLAPRSCQSGDSRECHDGRGSLLSRDSIGMDTHYLT